MQSSFSSIRLTIIQSKTKTYNRFDCGFQKHFSYFEIYLPPQSSATDYRGRDKKLAVNTISAGVNQPNLSFLSQAGMLCLGAAECPGNISAYSVEMCGRIIGPV
jgi:hypothetical protein